MKRSRTGCGRGHWCPHPAPASLLHQDQRDHRRGTRASRVLRGIHCRGQSRRPSAPQRRLSPRPPVHHFCAAREVPLANRVVRDADRLDDASSVGSDLQAVLDLKISEAAARTGPISGSARRRASRRATRPNRHAARLYRAVANIHRLSQPGRRLWAPCDQASSSSVFRVLRQYVVVARSLQPSKQCAPAHTQHLRGVVRVEPILLHEPMSLRRHRC
jgi:hypothetical protein